MNENFSKWNKRITAWILLIVGIYTLLMQYDVVYVLISLGSAVFSILGFSIIKVLKGQNTSSNLKIGDIPDPSKQQK